LIQIRIVDTTGSSLRKFEQQTSDVAGRTLRKSQTEKSTSTSLLSEGGTQFHDSFETFDHR
jgi:hypothetical protein